MKYATKLTSKSINKKKYNNNIDDDDDGDDADVNMKNEEFVPNRGVNVGVST